MWMSFLQLLQDFRRYSVRIVSHIDIFLMYLSEEVSSTSLYSAILISPPPSIRIFFLSDKICSMSLRDYYNSLNYLKYNLICLYVLICLPCLIQTQTVFKNLLDTEPLFEFPEPCGKFSLAVSFTYGNVKFPCQSFHISHPLLTSPLVHKSILYVSFSTVAL